jgi:hypothetical protein
LIPQEVLDVGIEQTLEGGLAGGRDEERRDAPFPTRAVEKLMGGLVDGVVVCPRSIPGRRREVP